MFERPFDEETVAALTADLLEQCEKVQNLVSVGRLQVKGWGGRDFEAAVFCAWIPSPLKIKIELTHPWGQPILYVLVDGEVFRFLSFYDRRFYTGYFADRSLSKFLPGDVNTSFIKDLARAYPVIDAEYRTHSHWPNQISFYERGEELKIVTFDRDIRRPVEVAIPQSNTKLVFSDFKAVKGLWFAQETALIHVLGGRRLLHSIETAVFNRTLPEELFSLQAPPGFETISIPP
ncbi:MAG: hypothetical protein JW836_09325 [Deltaproteobacteria bacterium]|nr:hypothetical protein [Deltaproteobacteria bacterium]